ncbi:MAG: insulinase family protein, partial [Chlamydiales bacterium]
YAVQTALSGFSIPLHLNNALQGLPYFKKIQELAKSAKKKPEEIIEKLLILKEKLFSSQTPHLVLSCDKLLFEKLKKDNFYGLANISGKLEKPWRDHFPLHPVVSHARPISSPVAFTVEAFKSIHYLHPHAPALSCAMPLFENTILHRKIREEGGAYGTGATFNPTFGNFYFHSYRDPKLAQTLSSFQFAIQQIAAGMFDERDLEEAKLGVIQSMDHPIPPGSRAATGYNLLRDGKTPEMRQRYRDTLLSLTKKQVQQVVETEMLPKKQEGVVISFASRELLESENALLPHPLPIITK